MTSKKGHIGMLYGVPIAIEYHEDGSVTVCKELAEYLASGGTITANGLKNIFDPKSVTIEMMNDNYLEFQRSKH